MWLDNVILIPSGQTQLGVCLFLNACLFLDVDVLKEGLRPPLPYTPNHTGTTHHSKSQSSSSRVNGPEVQGQESLVRTKKGSTKQHRVWSEPWKVVDTLTVISGDGNSGETPNNEARKMQTLLGQQQIEQGVQSREWRVLTVNRGGPASLIKESWTVMAKSFNPLEVAPLDTWYLFVLKRGMRLKMFCLKRWTDSTLLLICCLLPLLAKLPYRLTVSIIIAVWTLPIIMLL